MFDGRFGDVDLALLALFFVPVNGRNACSRRSSEIGWSKTSTEPPTNSSSTIDFFHDLRLDLGMGSFIIDQFSNLDLNKIRILGYYGLL